MQTNFAKRSSDAGAEKLWDFQTLAKSPIVGTMGIFARVEVFSGSSYYRPRSAIDYRIRYLKSNNVIIIAVFDS